MRLLLISYEKIIGLLIIALVGAITIALQALRVIDVLASVTEIWIWIAAILLGIAANLLTKNISLAKSAAKEPTGTLPLAPESSRPVASSIEANQEVQIPPQFEIAKCLNCGSKWPVEPLSPLAENILRIGTLYHEKDRPRTVTCPKCGKPAPVTAQPKNREKN